MMLWTGPHIVSAIKRCQSKCQIMQQALRVQIQNTFNFPVNFIKHPSDKQSNVCISLPSYAGGLEICICRSHRCILNRTRHCSVLELKSTVCYSVLYFRLCVCACVCVCDVSGVDPLDRGQSSGLKSFFLRDALEAPQEWPRCSVQ